ncbi:family 14 glycosylhydrolase [Streptomyces sp. SID1328]|uniref:beta-galactosidase n=1 Tax=Streptomyces sp. SID1328 TaxID=2690250 RepID=UPI00136C4EB8|nr:beta-galactosidase [Streptomyces sp. SID1328]MYV43874.1 family 14 glycosylhydrolase [Streptomyces sp. SID1328]
MTHPLTALNHRLGGIGYGGDYNPEQWPREVWREDVRLMREAGVNLVTVGVFSWSRIEPRPGVYDWEPLDEVLDLLHAHGIAVDLATPTAAPPPWFTKLHPDALPVTASGTRLAHGSRQVFCPSSPAYAEAADALVTELATRYADHPAVALWHVHNEWGNHNALCHCDTSAVAFRIWLRERYATLDALNSAWGTDFWSQRYGDWDEIDPPRDTTAFRNPGQELDFRRFSSEALLARHRAERALLKRLAPGVPVTTNVMGTLEKKADGYAFAPECDLVSVDHYLTAADPEGHIDLALNADLARGVAGGHPWLLMEHSTSAVNWQPVNVAKRPGELRRNSLTHLARGADGTLFFQWRQSTAGAEKWHSAMLPHGGTDTRIWREVRALGAELSALGEVAGTRVRGEVALLFDWPNWWALELEARPSGRLRYLDLVRDWYAALWSLNLTCDVVPPGADLTPYRAVVAPNLYLLSDQDAGNLDGYVRQGGHLTVGCFSGVVDDWDRVRPGGYPGALRDVLGLRVDEYLPLRPGETARLDDGTLAHDWAERVEPRGCSVVLRFVDKPGGGPAAGGPAVTRHAYGRGSARYVATRPSARALRELMRALAEEAGVRPVAAEGVEAVRRTGPQGSYLFLINHTDDDMTVPVRGSGLLDAEVGDSGALVPAGGVVVVREHE